EGLPENVSVVAKPSEDTPAAVAGAVGAIGCVQADNRLDRVRAFVKIQDGCSFSCTFCVIPLVRGATRSRSAAAVLAEIRRRAAQGHREIVLTGVNLGCFRDRAPGYSLARLVREAGTIDGVERLRLSSIEVNHVSDELVSALRETPTVKKERSARLRAASQAACERHWRRKLGADDLVLVDRPGRGYGDDYSPWLLDAPVGALVRARAVEVSEEGIVAVAG